MVIPVSMLLDPNWVWVEVNGQVVTMVVIMTVVIDSGPVGVGLGGEAVSEFSVDAEILGVIADVGDEMDVVPSVVGEIEPVLEAVVPLVVLFVWDEDEPVCDGFVEDVFSLTVPFDNTVDEVV